MATTSLRGVALFWAGMIVGVSFVATPAKFLAPSLRLPVALDVGHQTFAVFNPLEIACCVILIALLLASPRRGLAYALGAFVAVAVALQSAWVLPALDARVQILLEGGQIPESPLHNIYITLDALKVVALLGLTSTSRLVPRR